MTVATLRLSSMPYLGIRSGVVCLQAACLTNKLRHSSFHLKRSEPASAPPDPSFIHPWHWINQFLRSDLSRSASLEIWDGHKAHRESMAHCSVKETLLWQLACCGWWSVKTSLRILRTQRKVRTNKKASTNKQKNKQTIKKELAIENRK